MKKITFITLLFCVTMLQAQERNYTIKNIETNTKYSDFGVTYYGDGSAVFASSRKDLSIGHKNWNVNKQPYLELYKGEIASDGEIKDISLFSKNINTKYHESNVTFTKDLKTVYFSRNNYFKNKIKKDTNGIVLIQLYKASVDEKGKWTNIEPMPFNSDNYQTGHPALNAAEDKLFFTSDMPGSIGKTDIYVVDINPDGTYGTPMNLGTKVNTPEKEMFPFVRGNDLLYFSSDGYSQGRGGLDVYVAKILGSKVVDNAKNLGFVINSNADDFGLVYKKDEKSGYFSSNRTGGKGDDDIYYFEDLTTPIQYNCEQIVDGTVRDKDTGALLPGAMVELHNLKGEKLQSVMADDYAKFKFKVTCETAYTIIGSKNRYKENTEAFTTTVENDLVLNLGIDLAPNDFVTNNIGQLMIAINPIYFDLDKSSIRPDAAIELEKVVRIMNKYPELKIEFGSHTDSRASDKYNWDLSNRRAISTTQWIIDRGINASRITGKGYGETQLVNKCANGIKCSDAQHQLNRRSEFIIVNPEIIK